MYFILEIIFYILLAVPLYTYLLYPVIIYLISGLIVFFSNKKDNIQTSDYLPEVTLFVAAYNEKDFAINKINNSFSIDYPKLKHIWITDGSNDGTEKIVGQFPEIKCFHQKERQGKIAALNRGMKFVETPIVVFSDANTDLNKDSVSEIVKIFSDKTVGCVAGEKRIITEQKDNAASSGEGIYWKFERLIKKSESQTGSVVGAAGELFAIRTELYRHVENDTILDDFVISMRIATNGYKIKYTSQAYACEYGSENVKEELKRKIRIAAGGLQALSGLKYILNPFKYGFLSFKFFSHKVLRWTLAPLSFFMIFPINMYLAFTNNFFH